MKSAGRKMREENRLFLWERVQRRMKRGETWDAILNEYRPSQPTSRHKKKEDARADHD